MLKVEETTEYRGFIITLYLCHTRFGKLYIAGTDNEEDFAEYKAWNTKKQALAEAQTNIDDWHRLGE